MGLHRNFMETIDSAKGKPNKTSWSLAPNICATLRGYKRMWTSCVSVGKN